MHRKSSEKKAGVKRSETYTLFDYASKLQRWTRRSKVRSRSLDDEEEEEEDSKVPKNSPKPKKRRGISRNSSTKSSLKRGKQSYIYLIKL